MAHREFLDAEGTRWDVWEVNPSRVERELDQARAEATRQPSPPNGAPARKHSTMVASALSSGWLCFESGEAKRRLAPIPPRWEEMPSAELSRLCREAAVPVRSQRRNGPSDDQSVQPQAR